MDLAIIAGVNYIKGAIMGFGAFGIYGIVVLIVAYIKLIR